MTSNATRKTKTKTGAPNYCSLYKNLQEDHAEVLNNFSEVANELEARKAENKSLHNEIDRLLTKKNYLQLENEQLQTEARRSLENLTERNYYRKSARLWFAASVVLLIMDLALAVLVTL